ncbi:MAG: hydrogenase expression/formation C-terminal domain-containing protein [Steroidobacteraceae bacterium]
MSRLTDIPIRIEGPAIAGGPRSESAPSSGLDFGVSSSGVSAILTELARLLDQLAENDSPAAIDLRSLPLSLQDRTELKRALGKGEVEASVNADGVSTLRETRICGVWWVEHRDAHGELIAELLEVTRVPEILASASDEIVAAARTLRERLGLAARPC